MAPPRTSQAPPPSPFFRPGTPRNKILISAEGGVAQRPVKVVVEEAKAGIIGTASNLINAIVGSGIVGIPYSVYCSGIGAGTVLVVLCALLTLKSLRLLIGTAQEISAPSYETLCEAAFGSAGFYFIVINMFIMAYGAMVSYLMIIKDTLPVVMGVDPSNLPLKRSLLFVLSILIIVPLSSQRDMAQLAKTSRISVLCDLIMVVLVAWNSYPLIVDNIQRPQEQSEFTTTTQNDIPWIKLDTLFVGLGVLSFAFVCQHSAFIIAGSLERPNRQRWGNVTALALSFCAGLALLCGLSGYLGFLDQTQGNILNNLPSTSTSANTARALLGSTMLFVYPMESFVARHVLVVTLFEGRRAHEGEDASVLSRRDRRLALTMALYILSIVPALVFENLGNVLSVTGAIGGSCLSYIGPGMCYLGVYGKDFIEDKVKKRWFPRIGGMKTTTAMRGKEQDSTTTTRVRIPQVESLTVVDTAVQQQRQERTEGELLLTEGAAASDDEKQEEDSNCLLYLWESFLWYLFAMPLWCWIASVGKVGLEKHEQEEVLKSPHLSRIAANATTITATSSQQQNQQYYYRPITPTTATVLPPDTKKNKNKRLGEQQTGLSPSTKSPLVVSVSSPFYPKSKQVQQVLMDDNDDDNSGGGIKRVGSLPSVTLQQPAAAAVFHSYQKQTAALSVMMTPSSTVDKQQQETNSKHIPGLVDYLVAIFYMVFGVIAMCAGLVSIFNDEET